MWPGDASVQPAATPRPVRTDFLGDPLPDLALCRIGTARMKHPGWVSGMEVSSDGLMVASSSTSAVCVWDAKTGKRVQQFDLPHWGPWALTFSPDNKELAATSHGGFDIPGAAALFRWNLQSGKTLSTGNIPPATHEVVGVALVALPGGGHYVAETKGNDIDLYTAGVASSRKILTGHQARVMCVAFSKGGDTLVSLSADGTVRFWKTKDGEPAGKLTAPAMKNHGLGGNLAAIALSPDGKTIAISLPDASIRLVVAKNGNEIRSLPFATQSEALVFSADGKFLYTCSSMIQAWDVESGKELPIVGPSRVPLRSLTISPDGRLFATADEHETIRLVETATGLTQFQGTLQCKGGIAFSPDSRFLAAAADKAICFWEIDKLRGTNKVGAPATVLACKDKVVAFAFSPDGKRVATAEQPCACRIYDLDKRELVVNIAPPGHAVYAVAFSPNGKLLATMGLQPVMAQVAGVRRGTAQAVRIWDSWTAAEKTIGEDLRLTAHTVTFHPDSKVLAALHLPNDAVNVQVRQGGLNFRDANEIATKDRLETIRLWDVLQAREIINCNDPLAVAGGGMIIGRSRTVPVAFSPEGKTVAVPASGDIIVYEAVTGLPRLRLRGHLREVCGLAFTPDGQTLVSASEDGTALIWDVTGLRTPRKLESAAEELWDMLSRDPEIAGQAVWALVSRPTEAMKVLRERLHPVRGGDEALSKWIAELDAEKFAVRDKATRELIKLGPGARDALAAKLKEVPPLEVQRRIEKLLLDLKAVPPTNEQLQLIRAVEALDRIGTPDARRLLRELADGAEGALLTTHARMVLEKMR
jgi:WD40 repeat protein